MNKLINDKIHIKFKIVERIIILTSYKKPCQSDLTIFKFYTWN